MPSRAACAMRGVFSAYYQAAPFEELEAQVSRAIDATEHERLTLITGAFELSAS